VLLVTVAFVEAEPVKEVFEAIFNRPAAAAGLDAEAPAATLFVALAVETGTTESRPAPITDTTVSAMRLRSVVFDICFLSLVRYRNFLNPARKSFDLLILIPYGTHV
jgi:hypothetical protein